MRSTKSLPRKITLAAAALACAAAPALALALAPPPDKGGGGGGGSTGTEFWVEVADDPAFESGGALWVPMDGDSPCLGWSAGTSGAKPDYNARWRVDGVHLECQDLTTSTGHQLTDDIVVKVMLNSAGQIHRIRVSGQDVIGSEGWWHQSDEIDVAPTTPSNSGFTIHVHAKDVQMWKCNTHLLKKNTKCDVDVGTFSIDDMIYVPTATATSIESTIRYAPGSEPQ